MGARDRFGHQGSVLVGSLCMLLSVSACSSTSRPHAGAPTTTAPVVPTAYQKQGPYKVGVATQALADRSVLIFYPADEVSARSSAHITSYDSGNVVDPGTRAQLSSVIPPFVTAVAVDEYRDPKINTHGPFPVVLFSHGLGTANELSSLHLTHLASWGFVVAAPEHKERDLAAVSAGKASVPPTGDQDIRDLANTLQLLRADNSQRAGRFSGALDLSKIAVEGHSAGGLTATQFAAREPAVKAVIAQAPSPVVAGAFGTAAHEAHALATSRQGTPPNAATLIIAPDHDVTIATATTQAVYTWLQTPKRLIMLKNSGHNVFTDLCPSIRARGGFLQYLDRVPASNRIEIQAGHDGCTSSFTAPDIMWPFINHVVVAELRYTLSIDHNDASLTDAYLRRTFPQAFASQQVAP
jgi:alpha-beta hydrolase superfamily lysophospholipase